MIIIELTYKKSLTEIEKHLTAHRDFLKTQYAQGLLLASGPKNPRDGGIILSMTDKSTIEALIKQDPFYQLDIADYKVIEFDPVLSSEEFKALPTPSA